MGLWTVVVAQLVERSLLTPEIGCSNPKIGKILSANYTIEKTNIEQEARNGPSLRKNTLGHVEVCKKLSTVCFITISIMKASLNY